MLITTHPNRFVVDENVVLAIDTEDTDEASASVVAMLVPAKSRIPLPLAGVRVRANAVVELRAKHTTIPTLL